MKVVVSCCDAIVSEDEWKRSRAIKSYWPFLYWAGASDGLDDGPPLAGGRYGGESGIMPLDHTLYRLGKEESDEDD